MKIRCILLVTILLLLHPKPTEAFLNKLFQTLFGWFFCLFGFWCEKCIDCHPQATCTITGRTYTCTCNDGFVGDGKKDCAATSKTPTRAPSMAPVVNTNTPTKAPSMARVNTSAPTKAPSMAPVVNTNTPTKAPSMARVNTNAPTKAPSKAPVKTNAPTKAPSNAPVNTNAPTKSPSKAPTSSKAPTKAEVDQCSGIGATNSCDPHATCTNTDGSYKCTCHTGYDGDGKTCVDKDECANGSPCGDHAACTNTDGSYECKCNEGYFGKPPSISCIEITAFSVALTSPSALTYNPLSGQLCFTLINADFDANAGANITLNDSPFVQSPLYIEPSNMLCTPNVTFVKGKNDVVLGALTSTGASIKLSESFWCGSYSLIVNLIQTGGDVYNASASVTATLADNSLVKATKTTSSGSVAFENLPPRTIIFTALGEGNDVGSAGANPSASNLITIKLQGFNKPSDINNNDFAEDLKGWETDLANGVSIVPHEEIVGPHNQTRRQLQTNSEDKDLEVSTGSVKGLSVVSRTFKTKPGVEGVLVRYRFVTLEFPNGYFGSQYNDYFQVNIRSLLDGGFISEANSMNDLGKDAFDYLGSTSWREIMLPVNVDEDTVQVDITVTNVGDGLYNSFVYVDFVQEQFVDNFTSYDVVVVGGGTGGVAAAIEAARMGRTVALLEETEWLGGQMSAAGVTNMDENFQNQDSGFYAEFLKKMLVYYDNLHKSVHTCMLDLRPYCFEPSPINDELKKLVKAEPNIKPYYNVRVTDVFFSYSQSVNRQRVTGIRGIQKLSGGQVNSYVFNAKITIDATETGDVLEVGIESGIKLDYRIGKHIITKPTDVKDYENDCLQDITYVAVIKNYGVHNPLLIPKQAYLPYDSNDPEKNFSKFVALDGNNWTVYKSLPSPANWDSFVGYRGMPDSYGENYTSDTPEKITRTAVNFPNDFPITAGNLRRENRREIWCEAKLHTLHFLYYMQHVLNETNWSVANDEGYNSSFNEKECSNISDFFKPLERHMPVMPYVREGRRVVGLETVTGKQIYRTDNCTACVKNYHRATENFPHALSVGDYGFDLHGCNNASDLDVGDIMYDSVRGPFQVPFEAFVPKNVDGMLVAEKNIAVSRLVNGAIRLQPITMLTGQAVGAIAALSIKQNVQPRDLKPLHVQRHLLELKEHPCRLALQDFQDVKRTNDFWRDVQLVAARGIMVGYDDITFGSDKVILRSEAAAIVVNTFEWNLSTPQHSFADVNDTHWAYKYIETLFANDVTSGCSESPPLFCPNDNVTRAEFATFLVRAKKINVTTSNPTPYYTDVPSSNWYFPFVQIARERGWFVGCTDTTFCPNDPILRLHAARVVGAVLDDIYMIT